MWRKFLLILSAVLPSLFYGICGKDIYLSKRKGSENNNLCGVFSHKPCKTFAYTFKRLSCGDSLKMEGGYTYTVKKRFNITCDMHFEMYSSITLNNHRKETLKPPIIKYIGSTTNESFIFLISANKVTVNSIIFGKFDHNIPTTAESRNTHCWFKGESQNGVNVRVRNSIFQSCIMKFNDEQLLHVSIENVYTAHFVVVIRINCFQFISNHTSNLTIRSYGNKITLSNASATNVHILAISFDMVYKTHIQLAKCVFTNKLKIFVISVTQFSIHDSILNNGKNLADFSIAHVETVSKLTMSNTVWDNLPLSLSTITTCIIKYNTFQNNVNNKEYSALALTNFTEAMVQNCIFQNNTLDSRLEVGLTSDLAIRQTVPNLHFRVCIENVTIVGAKVASTLVEIKSVHDIGNVIFTNLSIKCGKGKVIQVRDRNRNPDLHLAVSCQDCEHGFYISTQILHWKHGSSVQLITYLINKSRTNCITCPYGGVCQNGIVRSKGGYWGYANIISSSTRSLYSPSDGYNITFMRCPTHYCCATEENCASKTYNACARNRKGRLCSQCVDGFSNAIGGKFECVNNETCHVWTISVFVYIILSLLFLVLLLYLKEIKTTLKRMFQTESSKLNYPDNNDSSDGDVYTMERLLPGSYEKDIPFDQQIPYQILKSTNLKKSHMSKQTTRISGCIKILLFFYQACALLRVRSVDKIKYKFANVLDFVMSTFNIRPNFSYSQLSLCVKPNMSVLDVRLFELGYMLSTLALILLLSIVCTIKNVCFKSKNNRNQTLYKLIDEENTPYYSRCPLQVRLKCAYLQLLLIGYSGIALFSFTAVHCVKLDKNNASFLYVQASTPCYQIWQRVLVAFICCWVVPFPFVLHCASRNLRHCTMLPNDFILVITCPPTYIYFLMKSKISHSVAVMRENDAMVAKHLLAVVEEPFKRSTKLCWESVLIFRRTILVAIRTFVIRPLNRIYPSALVLVLFLLHHCYERPYSDELSNTIEFVSFTLLLTLTFANNFWTFTTEYTLLTKSKSYRYTGEILLVYECIVLLLPLIIMAIIGIVAVMKWAFRRYKRKYSNA